MINLILIYSSCYDNKISHVVQVYTKKLICISKCGMKIKELVSNHNHTDSLPVSKIGHWIHRQKQTEKRQMIDFLFGHLDLLYPCKKCVFIIITTYQNIGKSLTYMWWGRERERKRDTERNSKN